MMDWFWHIILPNHKTWVDEFMESAGLEETGFLIEAPAADAGMNEWMNEWLNKITKPRCITLDYLQPLRGESRNNSPLASGEIERPRPTASSAADDFLICTFDLLYEPNKPSWYCFVKLLRSHAIFQN